MNTPLVKKWRTWNNSTLSTGARLEQLRTKHLEFFKGTVNAWMFQGNRQ